MARGPNEKLSGQAARCVGVALLLALVWAAEAPAQQAAPGAGQGAKAAADDAGGDTGHPATSPGAGAAGDKAQHHAAPHPDGEHLKSDKVDTANKGGRPDKAGEGTHDRAAKFGAKPDGKAGPTNLGTLDIAVPRRRPKVSARDRLFKKIEAVKAAHANPRRMTAPALPGGPARNAIGIIQADTHGPPAASRQPPGLAGLATRPISANTGNAQSGVLDPAPNTVHPPWDHAAAVVTALPRGLVNGTMVVHVGVGPAILGGPARLATGINGTTIKPRR